MKTTGGTAVDLDRSIRPGKWQKRGVQPEVSARPPSPMERIKTLLDEIRLEKDPAKKVALERRFQEQCKAFDMVDGKSLPVDIHRLYEEIADSFSLSELVVPSLKIPDRIGKDEWASMHKVILACRKSASQWLSQSRKFAVEKWGADFLADTEMQLELDLGIEHREQVKRIEEAVTIPKIQSIARSWQRLQSEAGGIDSWDKEQIRAAVDSLKPIVEAYQHMLERLGA